MQVDIGRLVFSSKKVQVEVLYIPTYRTRRLPYLSEIDEAERTVELRID